MRASLTVLVLMFALAGCAKPGPDAKNVAAPAPAAPPAPWSVSTLDPADPTPALLWNGLVGIRLGRDATGNGQPFFSSDSYQGEGEEKIVELPNPMPLEMQIAGVILAPEAGRNYRQTLDFRTGVLETAWKQAVEGGEVEVSCISIVHPDVRGVAQRWTLLAPPESRASLKMSGFAAGALRHASVADGTDDVGFEFGPERRKAVLRLKLEGGWDGAWDFSNGEALWSGRLLGSKELSFSREFELIGMSSPLPPSATFPADAEAQARLLPDIEVDGPLEDQQAIRSFIYYLRTSVSSEGSMSVAPFGLSDSRYFGHIFWDADIWVLPALALLKPDAAKAIAQYRLHRTKTANRNYREWHNAGPPTATGKLGMLRNADVPADGLKFPWESSVSGKETVPGPSRYQDHISGSVAFALAQAAALGLVEEEAAAAALSGVATYYRSRIERNADGSFSLNGTMSPDEYHIGSNDLYTNVLAQWCLNGGSHDRPANSAIQLRLPKDDKGFLTYDNDPLRSYKQAAAVLAVYPLQHPEAERQAREMMERFEGKVTPNGPAMSDSVHALIWARLGETERAYEAWRKSWMEFTDHPLMLFSEKRAKPVTYFATGAGGCLQAVFFGFLGFRIDDRPQEGSKWSVQLRGGMVLSAKPNLPKEWKRVRVRNLNVLGQRFTLELTPDRVRASAR
jgi:trehalose/maltose hydrolase-like predicted phosphorylase